MPQGERRVALHKAHLTTRAVADARPQARRYILWDDALIGFGVRVSPAGRRSFIVQYRTRCAGRETANRKKVLGHFPACVRKLRSGYALAAFPVDAPRASPRPLLYTEDPFRRWYDFAPPIGLVSLRR